MLMSGVATCEEMDAQTGRGRGRVAAGEAIKDGGRGGGWGRVTTMNLTNRHKDDERDPAAGVNGDNK